MSASPAALVRRELRALWRKPCLWAQLVVAGPLAGLAFRHALASGSGGDSYEAVVVDTLRSLFVALTLAFPFVVTSLFGEDMHNGALAFTAQLGHRPLFVTLVKTAVAAVAFVITAVPALSAVLVGGSVHAPTLVTVLAGHAAYALVVAGVAVVAVGLTKSVAASRLVALAALVALWALERGALPLFADVPSTSTFTPLAALHVFERGLVDLRYAAGEVVAGVALVVAGGFLVAPAAPLDRRAVRALVVAVVAVVVIAGLAQTRRSFDLSEGRRNSFPRAVEAELKKIGDPVRVTVRLRPGDPRAAELDKNVLGPLSRAAAVDVKRIDVDDKTYGLFTYQVGVRAAETRSTAAADVVPIVLELAGLKAPALVVEEAPHRTSSGSAALPLALTFGVWPLLGLVGVILVRRR